MALTFGEKKIMTVEELSLEGKLVFCRVDFNVPFDGERIADDTRIRAVLPTIQYLLDKGARVMVASHLGRPKGKVNPKFSLVPVAERLAEHLGREVIVPDDCVGDGVRKVLKEQKPENVILLENLRFHAGETKNDEGLAAQLKNDADVYVSDAFGALHRAHASVAALPAQFTERGVGFLVAKELRFLSPLLEAPKTPYAVILGGAKVSDKIKVIENLLRKVNRLYLGGAMVFTFLRALGHKTGNSLVEEDKLVQASRILDEAKKRGVEVVLPQDFLLGKTVDDPGTPRTHEGFDIPDGWMGLDVGPATVRAFTESLKEMKTVFWNGPLGLFEKPPFDAGTMGIAKALAGMDTVRIIGGGDSAAAVVRAGLADQMTHVSTGGGATLEYLEGISLPGLASLSV